MDAVKKLRAVKGWSAQQLAEEMTKAGVPWNADAVVNLEHGRRKSLRVHEFLALVFVLGVDKPLDVLIPGNEPFPVVPDVLVDPAEIRLWLRGEGRPLLHKMAGTTGPRAVMENAAQLFEQHGNPEGAATMRRLAALLALPPENAEGHSALIMLPPEGTDGQG